MYKEEETERSRHNISYVLKSCDSLESTIKQPASSPQSKMTASEEEEYFIKNNYVARTLLYEPKLAPLSWSNWFKLVDWPKIIVLCSEPFIALYGIFTTSCLCPTLVFTFIWGWLTGFGITAGYHRLFTHRSYEATPLLRLILLLLGAGAFQGSVKWWARGHRAHHRYTDTNLDPYDARKGLFYSHIGWLLMKPRRKTGFVDISDLEHDKYVQWQSRHISALNVLMGIVVPCLVCGLGWGDYRGGFFYAAILRQVIVHHATFCVNSLAHYLGDTSFDDRHTPRDHFLTAFVTLGEGYHNFHHEFPSDYRNALQWYQYDPTKLLISFFKFIGLASNLKEFPSNEIKKGRYSMDCKALDEFGRTIQWPKGHGELPIITFEEYQTLAKKDDSRALILIAGFIHDVNHFIDSHPGGRSIIKSYIGKDATAQFYGGVHDHNTAAHNMLAMMRVAICKYGGEVEHIKKRLGHVQTPTPIFA